MNVKLAQHLEGVSPFNTELSAYIWERNSFLGFWPKCLVRNNDCAVNPGVGCEPSVSHACKLLFCLLLKLLISLHPVHHFSERVYYQWIRRWYK